MLRYRHITRLLQRSSPRACSCSYSTNANASGAGGGDDAEDRHPIRRTLRLLGNDMRKVKEFFVPKDPVDKLDMSEQLPSQSKFKFEGEQQGQNEFQTHCDVLVIGGGGVGSSIAYWLKHKARDGLNVVVVEKDDTYAQSASCLSVGALRQQFSLPENIQMSLFAADFLRDAKEHFGEDLPLNFTPAGHLLLASDEGANTLRETSQLQNELGARNELLTPAQLSSRFPWLSTNGVALGCHGLEKEGWFDARALLAGYRITASNYGAHFVHGQVVDFVYQNQPDITIVGEEPGSEGNYDGLDKAVVQLPDGSRRSIKFALCVIAAGANSAEVARLAKIGTGPGMLRVPLPLEPRKRCVYAISTQAQNVPGIAAPLTIDPSGIYFRREGLGGNYICGSSAASDPAASGNLEADLQHFETQIRPTLKQRVPGFETAQVVDSWASQYEYNVYDETGIVGPHPYYHNLYIATGFSAHGMLQTPAVGRAISELIMDGQFRTIDLSRLSFDRLIVDRPMYELNIV